MSLMFVAIVALFVVAMADTGRNAITDLPLPLMADRVLSLRRRRYPQ